jgi:hypothetical protein
MKRIHEHRHTRCYGSPRMTVELRERGYACSENRVARLMARHGLAAKSRRPFRPKTTQPDRHFPPAPPPHGRPRRHQARRSPRQRPHLRGHPGGLALPRGGPRSLQPGGGGLEDRRASAHRPASRRLRAVAPPASSATGSALPLRSRLPIHQPGLPPPPGEKRPRSKHECGGLLLRQRHGGKLLRHPQGRGLPAWCGLCLQNRGPPRHLRLPRDLGNSNLEFPPQQATSLADLAPQRSAFSAR